MNKILPYKYSNLTPTIMSESRIYKYLDELLLLAETHEYKKSDICEGFCELIQTRLSDNYATINIEYSSRIFLWLSDYSPNCIEHLDLYLSVLVNLKNTNEIRVLLTKKLENQNTKKETELILGALTEIST